MWFDDQYFASLVSLVIASLLGGIIGFERAGKNHDAGLRTHILVCIGAATIMVLSKYLQQEYGNMDITRLGAQVISGIGFLGVGCIIVTGDRVKGLTTAAGLWTTACVGLVVGMGYYLIAVTVVALMLMAVLGLRPIAMKFQVKASDISMSVTIKDRAVIGNIFVYLNEMGIEISAVKLDEYSEDTTVKIIIDGHSKKIIETGILVAKLYLLDDVKNVIFL